MHTVSDFLIRIKNGYRANCRHIAAPSSKISESIAKLLKKTGYISGYSIEGDIKKVIKIDLAYVDREPKVTDIKIFSKPGRRLYEKASTLPWGKTPDALIIISTSAGLMSQKEAASKHLGGELIAEIF